MASWNKGEISTPDNPGGSKIMRWIAEHRNHAGTECLIWPFARDHNGYGALGREGKKIWAHRFMCELRNGPPPGPKHHAAHSCDNGYGGCVNPSHLSWKTPADNQLEGKKHPRHVLTPGAVADIRSGRESDHILAARYGVRPATIQKVRLWQTWVTGERRTGGFTSRTAKLARERQRASIPSGE